MEGKLSAVLRQGADRHDHLQDQLRHANAVASQSTQQVSDLKKAAHVSSLTDSAEPQQTGADNLLISIGFAVHTVGSRRTVEP